MKIAYKPTPEEVRKKRKEAYLSVYTVERQLEALTEAAMGRPERLDEMRRGLLEIREALPFSEEG